MTQKRKRYDKQFKIAEARVVLGGEMRAVDLAGELGIKDSTLRRWAQEYEEMGENAFPGNGSPKVNKGYEIAKLRKRIEEPGSENGSGNHRRGHHRNVPHRRLHSAHRGLRGIQGVAISAASRKCANYPRTLNPQLPWLPGLQ